MADCMECSAYRLSKIQNIISFKMIIMWLTVILIAAALIGFVIFFKSIDFFDKI